MSSAVLKFEIADEVELILGTYGAVTRERESKSRRATPTTKSGRERVLGFIRRVPFELRGNCGTAACNLPRQV